MHSGTSISTLRDKVDRVTNLEKDQNQRSEYMSIVQSFINNIMSEENIDKAIKQGSSFVGTSFLDKDSKRATYTNPSIVQNLNIFNIQNLRIVDNFIVNKTQNNNLYKFTYYAVNGENGSMSAKSVYSETDLFTLPNNIAEKILDSARLDSITLKDGGYLGRVLQDGQIIQNPQFLMRARELCGIKTM